MFIPGWELVFDRVMIILFLAPMEVSNVVNRPRSPWDTISLIIMLQIWQVKRVIDAYVLPVKVEMERWSSSSTRRPRSSETSSWRGLPRSARSKGLRFGSCRHT